MSNQFNGKSELSDDPLLADLEAKEYAAEILLELEEEIEQKNFVLPSLPDIAYKVKQAVDNPDAGSQQLAKIISLDPVLAGRIVQVANSPMFMGLEKVDSIATSIARLGIHCIRYLVTSFALMQIYNYKNLSSYKKQLKSIWQFSTYVAAISEVMAKKYKHIEHTEALMAGLMHNIGVLPAFIKCSEIPDLKENALLMSRVVHELQGNLGCWILKPTFRIVAKFFVSIIILFIF